MKSKYLKVKDHNIHYLTEGYGEYLIILPSLWATSKIFEEIGEKLAKHYSVIIPDIYKGKSKFNKPTRNINDCVFLLKSFLDKLKLEKYYLLGASYSGVIATLFSNTHPKRIKKLLLISTSATSINIKRKWLMLFTGYSKLLWNNFLTKKKTKKDYLKIPDTIKFLLTHPRQFINEAFIVTKNYDQPTTEMRVPSKLIFAEKDEFMSVQQAVEVHSQIKNLEIEVVDKTHSWGFVEQEEMVKMIKDYFK